MLLNSLDQSGFLFLNEYFCKLVTSQHKFIPSRTKEGFCCCCRVSFFVCIKEKTKRKAGRIKRNVRGKFSCPISWNMFTEGILIWVLERERTTYSNIFYTHPLALNYIHTLTLNTLFWFFIHSMLLHNYILFNVPFPFFFLLCVCILWCFIYFCFDRLPNQWLCVTCSQMHKSTYEWERAYEESEFLLHYDMKKVWWWYCCYGYWNVENAIILLRIM